MNLYQKLVNGINELFEGEDNTTNEIPADLTFVDVKTTDGRILRVSDIAVDATVKEITEDGEVEVEDSTFTLEDGTQLVVVGGIVTEVIPAKQAPAEDAPADVAEVMNEVFMDVTLKDGPIAHIVTAVEGEISVGDKMMIDGVEAGPGEYYTADGKTIVVGDSGVIGEVKDSEAEMPEADDIPAEADAEVNGIVNNLKELISQIKDLKSQFEEVKGQVVALQNENEELKGEVSKFSDAPSVQPTKTNVDFKKASKDEKLKFFSQR